MDSGLFFFSLLSLLSPCSLRYRTYVLVPQTTGEPEFFYRMHDGSCVARGVLVVLRIQFTWVRLMKHRRQF